MGVPNGTDGSFSFNREVAAQSGEKRMMLHAAETSLRYPFNGQLRSFHAASELPQAFTQLLRCHPAGRAPQPHVEVRKASARRSERLAARRFKR